MEAKFRVNPNLEITIDTKTQKDMFWELASTYDVFGFEPCRLCGCEDTFFFVRKTKNEKGEFEFPERKCSNAECGARLMYSLNVKGGTMYPVRKVDGKWDNKYGGWAKWDNTKQPTAPIEHDEAEEIAQPPKKVFKKK